VTPDAAAGCRLCGGLKRCRPTERADRRLTAPAAKPWPARNAPQLPAAPRAQRRPPRGIRQGEPVKGRRAKCASISRALYRRQPREHALAAGPCRRKAPSLRSALSAPAGTQQQLVWLCTNLQYRHCGLRPQSPDLQFEILNQVQNDRSASFTQPLVSQCIKTSSSRLSQHLAISLPQHGWAVSAKPLYRPAITWLAHEQ
jgi:hypothetical protein